MPHWRADDVTYFVTFSHRRSLTEGERSILTRLLIRPDGSRWDLLILCVLPERTCLIFRVLATSNGAPYELSKIVEKAKTKAEKLILKKTGEKYSPFYNESYDRILRNEEELEVRWQEIFDSSVNLELAESPEDYEGLWVAGSPNESSI